MGNGLLWLNSVAMPDHLRPYAKMFATVSALLIFGSWLLANTAQNRWATAEAAIRSVENAQESYRRHRVELAYLKRIQSRVDGYSGTPSHMADLEYAVAVLLDPVKRKTLDVAGVMCHRRNEQIAASGESPDSPEALQSQLDERLSEKLKVRVGRLSKG